MYVCICQAVTESEIRQAVEEGVRSFCDLHTKLGVASCCGTCEPHAQDLLERSLSASDRHHESIPAVYHPSPQPA